MSNKNKAALVPKYRFPEFLGADGWAVKKLSDVLNPTTREVEKPSSRYLAVGIRSHGKGTFHKPDQEPEKNSMDRLYLVHRNDLIVSITFAWEGAIAIACDSDHGGYVSHRFPTYEFKSLVSTHVFFRYVIANDAFTYKLALISPGGAGRNRVMNKKGFLEISVVIPSLSEQQKIADCLSSLDELIAAQARKVDALKTHKKGLMQQLFPREGETQPRLRFPEFRDAGEWGMKKLSSEIHLISGMHLSPEQYSSTGEVPYFSGPSDFTSDLNSILKWTKRSSNMAAQEDTLITVKGSGVGEVWFSTLQAVALGRQLMAVRVKEGASQFLYQFLLTKKARFEDLGSGNLIPGLSRTDILDMEASFPAPAEQQRIADCLTSLDTLITTATQELETLKTHKKGLMQQLFPSAEAVEA